MVGSLSVEARTSVDQVGIKLSASAITAALPACCRKSLQNVRLFSVGALLASTSAMISIGGTPIAIAIFVHA